MEKKFNIKITDNETGEVLRDIDTCAFIGGGAAEDGAFAMLITHCHTIELAQAVHSAEQTIAKAYAENPELKLATLIVGSMTTEETEQ